MFAGRLGTRYVGALVGSYCNRGVCIEDEL